MSRVHVVTEPLSDYVRFEIFWPYVDSVEAGEDVRLLPVAEDDWPSGLLKEDFWLFDSELVAVMKYDGNGSFVEAELTRDPDRVRHYIKWRDAALEASIAYREYVKKLV